MSEYESKQTDVKDAAVTHHFEHPDDSQGEVLETRYAGRDSCVWPMQQLEANGY
jgi:hypothetical protein